nr:unnamed protein product [Callosobruchus analis]
MSRNRFEQLLATLHFIDNETFNKNDREIDRLHKIAPLLEKMIERFQYVFVPAENICIDETMVPFRGRLKFRQYIKNKRHKFGIKLYKLCVENGYTHNIKVYCSKDTQNGGNASSNVVMSLLDGLVDQGRTLYTDNYYTSVSLAHKLIDRKTHLVGTVRANRKLNCTEVVRRKIKKNEVFASQSNTGVVMLKWQDKRDVLMLSAKHTDRTKTIKQKTKDIVKPEMIFDYNECKSYIDLSDQKKAYSHCLRRGTKWYRKLAFEILFGSAMVNAFIVFQYVTKSKISITEFKNSTTLKMLGTTLVPNTSRDEAVNHRLIETETKNRCVVCYSSTKSRLGRKEAQNKTPRSKYQCNICAKNYCIACFFEEHKGIKIL